MQDKKTAKHIQLDGFINPIFLMNGTLNWPIINGTESVPGTENHDGIEIRNPKNIICIDGTKYDGDDNRQELIDSNSANYDSNNKDHVRSNKVKGYLTTLSTYVPTLKSMEEQGATTEAIRAKISEYFDVETLIDYLIFGDVVDNWDGYGKNWQWTTYDGVKWFVNPYDLDGILGWTGWTEHAPNYTSSVIGTSKNYPTGWVYAYYFEELKARYAILRQKNVISAENISNILVSWTYRIGDALYAKDLKKWPMTPEEYSGLSSEHFDNVYRVYNWVEEKISICDTRYNYNIN